VVTVTDPYDRILGFLDRSRYFSIKQLLSCTHEAECTPFQTQYFSENVVVPGIESFIIYNFIKFCELIVLLYIKELKIFRPIFNTTKGSEFESRWGSRILTSPCGPYWI
jgi:hypothetical protein